MKNASYEFAARNLAIGLGLAIVAAKGVPESITIVTGKDKKINER